MKIIYIINKDTKQKKSATKEEEKPDQRKLTQ